jgi:hypothetical protein
MVKQRLMHSHPYYLMDLIGEWIKSSEFRPKTSAIGPLSHEGRQQTAMVPGVVGNDMFSAGDRMLSTRRRGRLLCFDQDSGAGLSVKNALDVNFRRRKNDGGAFFDGHARPDRDGLSSDADAVGL